MKNILRSFTPLSPSSKAGLNSIWRQTSSSHGMTLFGSAAAMVVAGYVVMAKINYALMKSAVPKVLRASCRGRRLCPVYESPAGTGVSEAKSKYIPSGGCGNTDDFEALVPLTI